MSKFGHSLLSDKFVLFDGLVNLNHGSFGTVPRTVIAAQAAVLMKQESCPELWFREWFQPEIVKGRQEIAALINADVQDVVLVENASYAINSIVGSFHFKDGDVIICYSCAYKMVMEALRFAQTKVAVSVVYIDIKYPIASEDELINSFELELAKHEKIAMCIVDHVSSMPTIVFPIDRLTAMAKQKNALVVIDGAHAPGMMDIDVKATGADLYTGNCHKWLFAPKGTAFLWTKNSVQTENFPQPCVISSSLKHDYLGRFEYTGTRDYTAFATLPAALRFVEQDLGGLAAMREHNTSLLRAGCNLLKDKWGTFLLVPESLTTGYMCNVALPSALQTVAQVSALQQRLMKEHHISIACHYVPRRTDNSSDAPGLIHFVRLSAQVYLELSDFELLADTVLRLLPEVIKD